MADLSLVQVKTWVDETDVGKLHPGQSADVIVAAYPNRPFKGEVLKIEPQADTIQNVTMFPVDIRIDNKDNLLKPGMNADVRIAVGQRIGVLAVPNAALRTEKDVASAGSVLGIDCRRPAADARRRQEDLRRSDRQRSRTPHGRDAAHPAAGSARPARARRQAGRTAVRRQCRRGGAAVAQQRRERCGTATAPVRTRVVAVAAGAGGRGGGGGGGGARRSRRRRWPRDYGFGGRYIVFATQERQGDARVHPDRAHRPRLLRGQDRARRRRFGAVAAERVAGATASSSCSSG